MADIDLSGMSVALMMNHRDARDTTVPTQNSIVRTMTALWAYDIKFEYFSSTGGDLNYVRNAAAERFLASEHTHALLWDSDLSWEPEPVLRVLWHALRYEVIGAGYLAKTFKPFWLVHTPETFKIDKYGCIPMTDENTGMGLGFTCVQRKVFEELSAKAPLYRHVKHKEPLREVFRFDMFDSEYKGETFPEMRGEDFGFFQDVRALGYTPMMDPSIELGHHGMAEFKGRFSDVLKQATPAAAA
jgi:hypothetical protein